jgi:acetyltransferase-like isoleucine patch superfamily enzyme
LCSGRADSASVEYAAGALAAIDLPPDYSHPLLQLPTMRAAEPANPRLGDLSLKRNLALLLAHLMGWRTVLMLDDDIVDVSAATVRQASAHLGDVAAVGLAVTDFPDNSVYGHARRLAGLRQDVFIGGSALLIDTTRPTSYFPQIYNEDWLFLVDSLWKGRVARFGEARQLPYDPFADPRRAEHEEFGDLLAEGLVSLTRRAPHDRAAVLHWAAEPECWRELRERRLAEVSELAELVHRPAAVAALLAAHDRATAITPASLAAYIRVWRTDVDRWRDQVETLPRALSLPHALRELGLLGHTRMWDRIDRPTTIGANCEIRDFCVVGVEVEIGDDTVLDCYSWIDVAATLGRRVLITHRAHVEARASIGDDCVIAGLICERSSIGDRCRVFGDLLHRQLDPSRPWDAPDSEESAPTLQDDVFVGREASIVGEVTVGAGVYVCAGAVVTRDVEPGMIVSGVNKVWRPDEWPGPLGKSDFFDR